MVSQAAPVAMVQAIASIAEVAWWILKQVQDDDGGTPSDSPTAYCAVQPPSIEIFAPVIPAASSRHR